ncbi:hypothetical protein MRX96_002475 [Rhipicephalus microplus]
MDKRDAMEAPELPPPPATTTLPAKQVRVEKELLPESADEAAESMGDTFGSGDEICVTTATLNRTHDETAELDKTAPSHRKAAMCSDEVCKRTATPDTAVQCGSDAMKKDGPASLQPLADLSPSTGHELALEDLYVMASDGDAGKGVVPSPRHLADELAAKA